MTAVIRILFLGANPAATTRLALEREVRQITQHLNASPHGDRFELSTAWAVRVGELQEVLLRHKPDVVHFSGHGLGAAGDGAVEGRRNLVAAAVVDEGGAILVEDDAGAAVPIAAEDLEELLRIVGGVRCVVLNACYSAAQCEALTRQVDCVVGMADSIADASAIAFAAAFYQGLGFGASVGKSFDLGRNQIALERLPGKDVPRLETRAGVSAKDVALAPAPAPEPEPERRRGQGRTLALVVLAVAALGMLGYAGYRALEPSAPAAAPIEAPRVPTSIHQVAGDGGVNVVGNGNTVITR